MTKWRGEDLNFRPSGYESECINYIYIAITKQILLTILDTILMLPLIYKLRD